MTVESIRDAVVALDEVSARVRVTEAIKENIDPQDILEKGLVAAMRKVGELFARKEYFVPEVLLASEAFYAGFELIKPLLKPDREKKAKVVIGVVEGDIHDIGKNIVKVMIDSSGYDVIDLGKDVTVKKFVETAAIERPSVLALSSLMTTTMIGMEHVIKELEKKGLRDTTKVIVGGAPLNREYAAKIGADGYGKDAAEAVKLIDRLVRE